VTTGNRSLTVTWTAPAAGGGSAITGYVVSVYAGASTQPVRTVRVGRNATSATVAALTNGTPYTVTVAAVNGLGTGAASAPSKAATPGAAPNAPTLRNATAGNGSATVTWRAPRQTGGSPITRYVVSVYQGTSTQVLRTVSVTAPATSVTVTGLANGTAYRFRVAAVNALGTGAQSNRSTAVRPRA
jgi:predicted phage tail protein